MCLLDQPFHDCGMFECSFTEINGEGVIGSLIPSGTSFQPNSDIVVSFENGTITSR